MNAPIAMLAYAAHWVVILLWLNCHRQIGRARRLACNARPPASSPGIPPRVTVILAARNESENLEACARSILAQRGVDVRLVIVDDRSTDATGEIARRLATMDDRIEVVRNDSLQSGWMGKTWACALGAARARGEWLLFTDADVRLEPGALSSAVAYAAAKRFDVFSLWPRDDSAGFWERLLVPLCGAMIVIWYGGVASESRPGGAAFANGQFLLVRRQSYEAFGGHAAVRSALIEDVALARAASRHGLRVGSALGADLVRVRMYASLREVVDGWRRIYVGVLSAWQMWGCLASLMVGSALPMVLLPASAILTTCAGATPWRVAWTISSAVQLAVLMSVSVRFFGLARCDRRFLWLYPLSVAGVAFILLAALRTRLLVRRVIWRGTAYRLDSAGRIENHAATN